MKQILLKVSVTDEGTIESVEQCADVNILEKLNAAVEQARKIEYLASTVSSNTDMSAITQCPTPRWEPIERDHLDNASYLFFLTDRDAVPQIYIVEDMSYDRYEAEG